MTDREAMQKAFEIIGVLKPDNFVHRELQGEAWDALRQALAQIEPPFQLTDAGADTNIPLWGLEPKGSGMVALHQREWVGLTDDDHKDFADRTKLLPIIAKTLAEFIEAKLKEKNT